MQLTESKVFKEREQFLVHKHQGSISQPVKGSLFEKKPLDHVVAPYHFRSGYNLTFQHPFAHNPEVTSFFGPTGHKAKPSSP